MAIGDLRSTTVTLTSAMQTYYDNRFLAYYKDTAIVQEQGQKRSIPLNAGKTIDFFRYHPYAIVTASGTEGTVGTDVATKAMSMTATLAVWKNYTQISEFLQLTSRDRNLENIVDLMAQNAAESLDWQTQRELALYGATYCRGDCNNTYQFEYTMAGNISASSTTGCESTTLHAYCGTDNGFIGSVVTFRKSYGYGCSRIVSDTTHVLGAIVWQTALPETLAQNGADSGTRPVVGWMCSFRGLALRSASRMRQGFQYRAITKACELLERANAPKFADGYYHGLIDPICKRQLLSSTSVLNYMQQSRPGKMERNQIGELGGVMWYLNTKPMRLVAPPTCVPASGSAYTSAFGNSLWCEVAATQYPKYYITWVFGQNAFGVVELSGRQRKIIVKTPGPQSLSVPCDEYSTVGWKAYWICKALNANYAVAIVTYQA